MAIAQLLQSIKQGNNKDLFLVDFDGIEVVFSLPTTKQALQLAKVLKVIEDPCLEYQIYSHIFNVYVTDDCLAKTNQSLPAGLEASISQVILFLSGASEDAIDYTEKLLELYRDNVNNLTSSMKRIICLAYGGYTFAALDKLNYQELVEIFVNAEQSLLERDIIKERMTITKPGGEEEEKSIGEMIQNDIKDYKKFNAPSPQKNPNFDLNKLRQQAAMKQRMANRGG